MWALTFLLSSLVLLQTSTALPVTTDSPIDNASFYEHQSTVWPIENPVDSVLHEQTFEGADSPVEKGNEKEILFYEDQLVVFPHLDDDEDTLDIGSILRPSSTTTTTTPSTTSYRPGPHEHIWVVENFQRVNADGSKEYKLVLSNGMQDYKKIYNKIVNGKVVEVQEGYYSVPMAAGSSTRFYTLHYISDERGYRVRIGQ